MLGEIYISRLSKYLGLLHATAITSFQNMLSLYPENPLVAFVLARPGPVFQFGE
jgi:hypothetical protein